MQRVSASCGSGSMIRTFFLAVGGMVRWMQPFPGVLLAGRTPACRVSCPGEKREWIMQVDEIHYLQYVSADRNWLAGCRRFVGASCDSGTRVHGLQPAATLSRRVGENFESARGEAADFSGGISRALCPSPHSWFGVRRSRLGRSGVAPAFETGGSVAQESMDRPVLRLLSVGALSE